MKTQSIPTGISAIEPMEDDLLNVVIETPRDCRNKYKYDTEKGVFKISKVLPAGSSFPYDFGFVPGTLAPDGDPLDVLVLMDETSFPGVLIQARVIGVIEAEQGNNGHFVENDRIIAIADESHDFSDIKTIKDINSNLLDEIEQFFVNYHGQRGKKFKPKARHGATKANELIEKAIEAYNKQNA